MKDLNKQVCCKCNCELIPATTVFTYLNNHFNIQVPKCPSCGIIFLDEETVKNRMAEVEKSLEEK